MSESMKAGAILHTGARLLWALPGDQESAAHLYGGDRSSGSGEAALPEGNTLLSEETVNLGRMGWWPPEWFDYNGTYAQARKPPQTLEPTMSCNHTVELCM